MVFYSFNAESQAQVDNITYYPPNESSIEENIVIVIDASGSTLIADPITNVSVVGLINSNAISLIRNVNRCSNVGIVIFGGRIEKMDMVKINNDSDRQSLEDFIRKSDPYKLKAERPTDIENGLINASLMFKDVDSRKEIIVISDGLISPEGFPQLKNTVTYLKNKYIKIYFVQILLSKQTVKEASRFYDELALAAGEQAIVLYPDERINLLKSAFESKEPCSTPTPSITLNPTVTINQAPNQNSLSTQLNTSKEQYNEENETVKTPGFSGVFTIFVLFMLTILTRKL